MTKKYFQKCCNWDRIHRFGVMTSTTKTNWGSLSKTKEQKNWFRKSQGKRISQIFLLRGRIRFFRNINLCLEIHYRIKKWMVRRLIKRLPSPCSPIASQSPQILIQSHTFNWFTQKHHSKKLMSISRSLRKLWKIKPRIRHNSNNLFSTILTHFTMQKGQLNLLSKSSRT